jgi:putative membrane protein
VHGHKKSLPVLLGGAFVGVALLAGLALSARSVSVGAALAGGGVPLVLASLYRLVPLMFNTMSWRVLLPAAARLRWRAMLRLRWIGESINALLPVAQIGGDFARARLLAHGGVAGVTGADATAAMVADISIGAATQAVFTLIGVVAVVMIAPTGMLGIARTDAILVAAALTLAMAAALVAVARVGVSRLVAALPFHARGRLAARLAAGAAGIDRALAAVLARRGVLVRSAAWHLAGWISQVGETWLILTLLGTHVTWGEALVIESLAATARGVAFAVPAGLGVQEGALVVLCAPFGIDLASALALGIIKRGRELLVGAPAIVAWAVAERHAISHFLRGKNMKERRRTHRAPRASVDGAGAENRLRVGVLVDLHWTPNAGGHVKTWERLAAAALASNDSLDLTVHFLGTRSATHVLGQHVRYRIHRPLFSTASLPFLSHIPDHTDLAPHNPMLTSRLLGYDVIHTTDGAFAAAQTAARVARWHGIPLTSSVHTTTPYYTRVFTAATIERLAGNGILRRLLLDRWGLAGGAEARMQRVVDQHHKSCAFVLASRADDHTRLAAMLGQERVGMLRRGIERALFHPARRDRLWLESAFGIARDRWVVISVGRLDRIKNVLVLAQAIRALVDGGAPVHLLCPGKGPDRAAVAALLGDRVTCPGVLPPDTLARAYASSDLCAQPAVIEELSNAVLEASSCGLPLLVGAQSGSARFVVDGETGLVVRGAEPEHWARAIEALLVDPARRDAMGAAARAWSLAHVPSWEQVLAEDLLPIWRRAGVHAAADAGSGGEADQPAQAAEADGEARP